MSSLPYYALKLKECLSERQKSNSSYSLRAYARDLGIHCGTLSQILKNKRQIPRKKIEEVADRLDLEPRQRQLFVESAYDSKSKLDKLKMARIGDRYTIDESSHYKVLSEWEHYAVLELFELKNFEFNEANIAAKLNLSLLRAIEVLENLEQGRLLVKNERGIYQRAYEWVKTTEDISSSALKQSHKETLRFAIEKLDQVNLQQRDYSSVTFALDVEKVPEVKAVIREFRQKLASLVKTGNKTEVYHLGIQLFPFSVLDSESS